MNLGVDLWSSLITISRVRRVANTTYMFVRVDGVYTKLTRTKVQIIGKIDTYKKIEIKRAQCGQALNIQ